MQVRTNTQANSAVATPVSILNEMQKELRSLQEGWSHQLQQDPSRFGQIEVDVHQTFQKMADQVAASLLGEVGQQPTLEEACKKSR